MIQTQTTTEKRRLIDRWYSFALPKNMPTTTPMERQKLHYAQLTSIFAWSLFILILLTVPSSFINPPNIYAPIITGISLVIISVAVIASKMGLNYVSAVLVILLAIIGLAVAIFTNPLDPAYLPVFADLVIPILFAGVLLPPVSALVVAAFNAVLIVMVTSLKPPTPAYTAMMKAGLYSISVFMPIAIQTIVAIVVFVVISRFQRAILRADRAEEIVALQAEITDFERKRAQGKKQLEAGIEQIVTVHMAVANGNLEARVPLESLGPNSILWQVAGPLNNLLSRAYSWKTQADKLEQTAQISRQLAERVRHTPEGSPPSFPLTGTPLDSLLTELNRKTTTLK